MTFLREFSLLKFDAFRPWMLILHTHYQFVVEGVKLLTTVSSDRPTQRPHNRKQEETLQPHGHLLAGHILRTVGL